jgi:hypothetical protein
MEKHGGVTEESGADGAPRFLFSLVNPGSIAVNFLCVFQ